MKFRIEVIGNDYLHTFNELRCDDRGGLSLSLEPVLEPKNTHAIIAKTVIKIKHAISVARTVLNPAH